MSQKTIVAELTLTKLQVDMHLGVGEQERAAPQAVHISLFLFFTELPSSCRDDVLSDDTCYDRLSKQVMAFCTSQAFRTIEYVGYQLYLHLRKNLPTSAKLRLTVEKCHPPIASLKGPASFSCGDSL